MKENLKTILAIEFDKERNKKRLMDEGKNQELVNHLGNALTCIEMSVKEKMKRLDKESIYEIYPELVKDGVQ